MDPTTSAPMATIEATIMPATAAPDVLDDPGSKNDSKGLVAPGGGGSQKKLKSVGNQDTGRKRHSVEAWLPVDIVI